MDALLFLCSEQSAMKIPNAPPTNAPEMLAMLPPITAPPIEVEISEGMRELH